jgi:hypothetical protein
VSCTRPWNPPTYRCGSANTTEAAFIDAAANKSRPAGRGITHSADPRSARFATKAALFDEYVCRSELKDQSPDAIDVSDLKAAEEVGNQVEAERRIIEMERKRLRTESHGNPS